ncbi:MAG: NFACT family protein [Clostridia bacterium]|nr:NFACT family protein [Clostridia bacterium]
MAYDAGMMAAAIAEIRTAAEGARIERITQPEKDEIVLQMRSFDGGRRLLINAGTNNPRMGFSTRQKENPASPPMFCMLLRKHLSGAHLLSLEQIGFERVARLTFQARDEMGFLVRRHLIAEIMGKYSNLIFTDDKDKILAVLRPVDFTTSSRRQVLPGMTYELPPVQAEKVNPLTLSRETFDDLWLQAPADRTAHKWLLSSIAGISAAVSREMVTRAAGNMDATIRECTADGLWEQIQALVGMVHTGSFDCALYLEGDKPIEYAFMPLTQYGNALREVKAPAGEVLDLFFVGRDHDQKVKQRAGDVLRILTAAESRIHRKLDLQRGELAACEQSAEYKKMGDLITANLYLLERGMRTATLTDYEDYHEEDGTFGECTVQLDERLTPAANAQRYFKKYAKSKTAKIELTRQIELGEQELTYIYSVFDALTHAETDADLAEIREELYRSGYASRMKQYTGRKPSAPKIARFITDGGFTVLCGKNNVQNEYITHRLADRNDYWFHAKGVPGSHVVLVCNGEEPGDIDFTRAAEIAAHFSKAAGGQNVPVDYTKVRNVKKPAGGKPGLVIYHTNWTAYVTPDAEEIRRMREK